MFLVLLYYNVPFTRPSAVILLPGYPLCNISYETRGSGKKFSHLSILKFVNVCEETIKKNITSSVYDCTVEDVEHVVIALTGAHMQPACVTELTSSEY